MQFISLHSGYLYICMVFIYVQRRKIMRTRAVVRCTLYSILSRECSNSRARAGNSDIQGNCSLTVSARYSSAYTAADTRLGRRHRHYYVYVYVYICHYILRCAVASFVAPLQFSDVHLIFNSCSFLFFFIMRLSEEFFKIFIVRKKIFWNIFIVLYALFCLFYMCRCIYLFFYSVIF